MRSWHIFLVAAFVVVVAALGGWYWGGSTQPLATGVEHIAQTDGLHWTLRLDQSAVDARLVDVSVRDAAGAAVDVAEARLRFWMTEMDMGIIEVEPTMIGTGQMQARGQFFTMAGHWNVDATLTRADGTPLQTSFRIAIAGSGEEIGPDRPLVADAQTVLAGQRLYLTNCVTCHGTNGRGDGLAAAGLNPRPSDFAEHMMLGKHTDGQVFLWIKNGYGNSMMPAWGQRLTEPEIWQLVAYLRTFGKQPLAPVRATPLPTLAVPDVAATAGVPQQSQQSVPVTPTVPDVPQPLPPLIIAREGNLWRSDGQNAPMQITQFDTDTWVQYPAVSPDGTRIAFVAISQPPLTATVPLPSAALYVMNRNGSDIRPLWKPAAGLLGVSAWSPDGSALYVAANGTPPSAAGEAYIRVVRVDVATGASTQVVPEALDPAIARDDQQMAFIRFEQNGASMSLQVATLDGDNSRAVVSAGQFEALYAPRFAPDGGRIVFAAVGGPETGADGVPLTSESPRGWSPLHAVAALFAPPKAEAHGLPWDVWQVNTDGSGLRRLAFLNEDQPVATFSPDGAQITLMGANGVYLMNADGSQLRRIDKVGEHGGLDSLPSK